LPEASVISKSFVTLTSGLNGTKFVIFDTNATYQYAVTFSLGRTFQIVVLFAV
jgi:hypothetical protein